MAAPSAGERNDHKRIEHMSEFETRMIIHGAAEADTARLGRARTASPLPTRPPTPRLAARPGRHAAVRGLLQPRQWNPPLIYVPHLLDDRLRPSPRSGLPIHQLRWSRGGVAGPAEH